MSNTEYILLLFGMGLVTYLPRWMPLVLLTGRSLPPVVTDWLDLIPVSLLAALLIPELLTAGSPRHFTLMRPEFFVAIPTFLFALKTRSLVGTVLFGMFLFWLYGRFIGG